MIIEVIYNQSFQNFEKEVGEYLDSFPYESYGTYVRFFDEIQGDAGTIWLAVLVRHELD
jgi:hypothetical protein